MARVRPSILRNTFIKHLDDEINNLDEKQVNDILKHKIDDIIPESKDNVIKNYKIVLETRRT